MESYLATDILIFPLKKKKREMKVWHRRWHLLNCLSRVSCTVTGSPSHLQNHHPHQTHEKCTSWLRCPPYSLAAPQPKTSHVITLIYSTFSNKYFSYIYIIWKYFFLNKNVKSDPLVLYFCDWFGFNLTWLAVSRFSSIELSLNRSLFVVVNIDIRYAHCWVLSGWSQLLSCGLIIVLSA